MCLLAVCPPGLRMTDEQIENAWLNNDDGGGFCHIGKGGKIRPFKTMELKAFKDAYHQAVKRHPTSPFIVHFRWATHGTKGLSNVHPFRISDDLYMAHNGMLPVTPRNKKWSDTKTFALDWLANLERTWLDNVPLRFMVEEFCKGSKLAFLSTDPALAEQVYILNEGDGEWVDGVWFSNDSYQESTWTGYKVGSRIGSTDWWDDLERDRARVRELAGGVDMEDPCEFCDKALSSELSLGDGQDPDPDSKVCLSCEVCYDCGEFFDDCTCVPSKRLLLSEVMGEALTETKMADALPML